jgi:hypothetical protein
MTSSVLSSGGGGPGRLRPTGLNFWAPPRITIFAPYTMLLPLPPGDSFLPPGEKNLDKTLMTSGV